MVRVGLAVLLLAACKGGSPSSSATAPEAVPTPATAPLIDIRPILITFRGLPIARLSADGHTEAVGQSPPGDPMSPGPTLRADGTIQLTTGGRTARLSQSGEIYVASPGTKETLASRIAGDHVTLGANGVHVDGAMMAFDDGRDDVGKIEGTVDAGMRRTALVMLAAFYLDTSTP